MIINFTNRDALEEYLKTSLTPERYKHSLGVEKMAGKLARIHGADSDKAEFAGRYHDIAKCLSIEKANKYIIKYGLPDKYLNNTALSHSKIAAEILLNEFSVTDEDVLNAIRSHTTGRAGMSLLEEIVYVADAIEENRNYPELQELQQTAISDLDSACFEIINFAIQMLKDKGKEIDEDTIKAREFIKKRLEKNMKNKDTALKIAEMLSKKKALDIVLIDISEKSSFADFFVNASVSSERQLNALAEEAQDILLLEGYNPRGKEGRPESGWILIDGGDVIVNLFYIDIREKYSLDKLWSDCNITIFE